MPLSWYNGFLFGGVGGESVVERWGVFSFSRADQAPRPSFCSAGELGPVIVPTGSAPTSLFIHVYRTESENPSASVGSRLSMLAAKVTEEANAADWWSNDERSPNPPVAFRSLDLVASGEV